MSFIYRYPENQEAAAEHMTLKAIYNSLTTYSLRALATAVRLFRGALHGDIQQLNVANVFGAKLLRVSSSTKQRSADKQAIHLREQVYSWHWQPAESVSTLQLDLRTGAVIVYTTCEGAEIHAL